jgi:glycosyltransferase involved in cell wall biosynthesis
VDFTFIVTSMGRLEQLRESLPACLVQPNAECIVVDYSCPQECGAWAEREHPHARIIRVPGESAFNAARARNAGARAASGRFLVFVDADVVCPSRLTDSLRTLLEPRVYVRAEPVVPDLGGTVAVPRADFERVEGYDEVIQGWGGEDDDLYARFHLDGMAMRTIPASWFRWNAHSDEERTRRHELKDRQVSHGINISYVQAKIDAMRLVGRALSLQERQALYHEIRTTWLAPHNAAADVEFEVRLPARKVLGLQIDTLARYRVVRLRNAP